MFLRSKKFIRQGDAYQVNLSYDKIGSIAAKEIVDIIQNLLKQNPAPYQGIFKINQHLLVSTSPERLFLHHQEKVISSPIKGTIANSKIKEKSQKNKKELLESKKDLAELTMIGRSFEK